MLGAIEEFAQELAFMVRRFLRLQEWRDTQRIVVGGGFRNGRLFAALVGMAAGGWVSGLIFDLTGSYLAAFANGVAWNAVNVVIVATLMIRARGRMAEPARA